MGRGRGDRWRFGAAWQWGTRAKEGMCRGGRGGLIPAVSADGVATKPCFYRNCNMGRGAGFFLLAKADRDQGCWGQWGAARDHPAVALSLPAQVAGSRGLPGELTCCSASPGGPAPSRGKCLPQSREGLC